MKKEYRLYAMAFVLPVTLWGVIYAIWGQAPFGDKTLLIWDMKWQYVSFFSHLRDIMHGEASIFYSFSRALGGEMLGVLSYYLLSPFNLIIYFFDKKIIYIGILVIALCKVGTTGLTMYAFLARRERGYSALIFSCAYAVSSYVVAYQFNIFWMDALILLPLMVLGIEKLVDEKKSMLYIIVIALGVITNFYTGYMLCVFSVLYFLCYFFLISETRYSLVTILRYAVSSLLGGMLAMGIALPTLFALQGGKANQDYKLLIEDKTPLLGYMELFRASFCGEISNEQMTVGKPLLYCSVLAILFVGYYLINMQGRIRQKIAYALLLIVLMRSFKYNNLNCMWHGMQSPMGSPYRFAFIYVFLIIEMAHAGFVVWKTSTDKKKIQGIFIVALILLLLLFMERGLFFQMNSKGIWLLNMGLVCAYLVLLFRFKAGKWVLAFLLMVELALNAEQLYLKSAAYQSVGVTEWESYVKKMEPLVEHVGEQEGFFRVLLTGDAHFSCNDGLLWNLYSLESYTSLEKVNTQQLARNLGYSHGINFGMSYGTGATTASDILLGVRYIISSDKYGKPYKAVYEKNGLTIWENEEVLPIVYFADEKVLKINPEQMSLFNYENAIFHNLCSIIDKDIYKTEALEFMEMQNLALNEFGKYVCKNDKKDAYIAYRINVSETGDIYLQDFHSGAAKVELEVNGKVQDISEQTGTVKRLGVISSEDDAYIRFYLDAGGIFDDSVLHLVKEQREVLTEYTEELQKQNITIAGEENDIVVQCKNNAKERRCLMFTIPYDKGWHAYVDGEEVTLLENKHQMIFVPVEEGEHTVELVYVPQGWHAGLLLSFVAVILIGMKCLFSLH